MRSISVPLKWWHNPPTHYLSSIQVLSRNSDSAPCPGHQSSIQAISDCRAWLRPENWRSHPWNEGVSSCESPISASHGNILSCSRINWNRRVREMIITCSNVYNSLQSSCQLTSTHTDIQKELNRELILCAWQTAERGTDCSWFHLASKVVAWCCSYWKVVS